MGSTSKRVEAKFNLNTVLPTDLGKRVLSYMQHQCISTRAGACKSLIKQGLDLHESMPKGRRGVK